jgi:hypothetical protein
MAYTILHCQMRGPRPHWYHLEFCTDDGAAKRRANGYALDHGGYVCVKDHAGKVIFGTDPEQLDRSIKSGRNRYFTEVA